MEVVHAARAISWRAKRLRPTYHVVDIDTSALCVGAASCCAGGLFAVCRPQHGSATFWSPEHAMNVRNEHIAAQRVVGQCRERGGLRGVVVFFP